MATKKSESEYRHCDDYINDPRAPRCLRLFLLIERLPAVEKGLILEKFRPRLLARYKGKKVRVTMASRFGDVGITEHLGESNGYDKRVAVEDLTDFSEY